MFGRKNKANSKPFSESIGQNEGATEKKLEVDNLDAEPPEQEQSAPASPTKMTGLSPGKKKLTFSPKKKVPSPAVIDTTSTEKGPEYKFGIDERLESAVAATAKSKNDVHRNQKRSPDLVPLSKEFESMRKNVRNLIVSAKQYQDSMNSVDQQRMKMVQEIGKISKGSPIEKPVDNTADKRSVLSIVQKASDETGTFQERYQAEVLDYVTEWEAVISSKVDSEQAKVKELRKTFEHYQSKVEGLRKKVNNAEKSGKGANETVAEKLQRNTEKLDEASAEFEQAAAPLCNLITEVVHEGWRDLLPMLYGLMQFEADRAKQAYNTLQKWKGGESLEDAAPLESIRAKDKVKDALKK